MIEEDLRSLASDLEGLKFDPAATVHHEVMSDALVWSDELLHHRRAREIWCMRPVFRYRTCLILGFEVDEFKEDWNIARATFPRWIGFRPERCQRNENLELLYRKLSGK